MPMKTSSPAQPPPLEAARAPAAAGVPEAGRAARPHPVVAGITLAALAGAVGLVRAVEVLRVPLPFCGLRRLTGLPCPACGSTRSLLAWAEFHPLDALRLNPLLFCVMIGLAAWA